MGKVFTPTQNNWQWFANDAAEPSTSLGAENTKPATGVKTGVKVRLRLQIYETGGVAGSNLDIDCEYSYDESTWYDVGDQAGTNRLWRWADGAATEHNATTTYKLTNSDEHGEYHESTCANTTDVGASKYHEIDLCLEQYDAIPGKTYYFRIQLEGAELVLNGAATHPSIDAGTATNWLTGWSRRKYHVINGSTAGAQTDYQKKIIVNRSAGSDSGEDVYVSTNCLSDYGDVRFTKNDGDTAVDYWLVPGHDSSSGDIWVEVPSIPTTGEYACVYIYYNKSGSTTTSNKNNTMPIADYFTDNSRDTGLWDAQAWGGSVSETSQHLEGTTTGSGWETGGYVSTASHNHSQRWSEVNVDNFDANESMIMFVSMTKVTASDPDAEANWYRVMKNSGDSKFYVQTRKAGGSRETLYSGAWTAATGDMKVSIHSNTIKFYEGTNERFSETYDLGSQTLYIYLVASGSVSNYGTDSFDNFLSRNYCDPEPAHGAWGTEESTGLVAAISYSIATLMKVLAMI